MEIRKWLQLWKTVVIALTPLLLLPLPIIFSSEEARCAYIILIMTVYWMTDAIPLAATAFIPVFGFPMLGVLSTSDVCEAYFRDTNMLFLGGLAVAVSVEHCNLHKRLALLILLHVGNTPERLILGFMTTQMFLSMWISNTAATAMMIPIVEAILEEIEKQTLREIGEADTNSSIEESKFGGASNDSASAVADDDTPCAELATTSARETLRCVRDISYLGITYSSNLGGTGTITGTNPNLVLMGFLETWYPAGTDINYASWLIYNIPGMLICTTLSYIFLRVMLYFLIRKSHKITPHSTATVRKLLEDQYNALGQVSYHEKTVIISFTVLVFLWFFRAPRIVPGWGTLLQSYLQTDVKISSASPAMLVVFLLFALPSKPFFKKSSTGSIEPNASPGCLTWKVIHERLPWGVIILIGSGFAIARASNESGLSKLVGFQFQSFDFLSVEVLLLLFCILTAFLTEIVSNTATAAILLPVLNDLAHGLRVNPLYFLIPATLCCSYAFMLPVATPPNAIVFDAAKDMPITRMMKAGFFMNIVNVMVTYGLINSYGDYYFELGEFPSWANRTIINTDL